MEAQLQAQAEAMRAVFQRLALGGSAAEGGGVGGGVGGVGGVGGGVGGVGGVGSVGGGRGGVSAETQTEVDETTKYWQQQLIAVSDWLQTGTALLQQPEPAAEPAADRPPAGRHFRCRRRCRPRRCHRPRRPRPTSAAEGQPVPMVGGATISGRPMGGGRGAGRGAGSEG